VSLTFQQTDVAGICIDVYCSGLLLGTSLSSKKAPIGGAAGVTAVSVTHGANTTTQVLINFECAVPDDTFWTVFASVAWTDAINVTTANSVLTWARTDRCRVSSLCVNQGEVLVSFPSISLGTTGIKSASTTPVSRSESNPSSGDMLVVVIGVSSTSTMQQSFSYKPDQAIVASFVRGLTGWHRPTYPDQTDVAPAVMVPSG
jgi:hypothetical protein